MRLFSLVQSNLKSFRLLLVFIAILLSYTIIDAQATLSVQGIVKKSNGDAIDDGEYLRWAEDNLTITGSINNSTGVLWNNANITMPNFINTGVYKGTGYLIGNMINQNVVSPGN